jgi:ribosomal protein L24
LPSLPVPIDYGDTQAILWPKRNEIQEGDCVRILKGTYKGDLGYALKQLGQDAIRIALVPRLSLAPPAPFSVPNDAQQPDDGMQQQEKCKKRKKAAPRISRPPAIPFDVDRARAIFGYNCVTQGDTESRYTFRPRRVRHDQTFERGLLILDLYASGSLKRELHPSSEELIPLAESGIDGDRLNRRLAAYFLRAGDRIMITEGNYQGLFGKILDTGLDNDSLLVEIFNENSPNWTVTVRAAEICQDLRVGDCVRAIAGGDKGAHGVITMVHPRESFDVQGVRSVWISK